MKIRDIQTLVLELNTPAGPFHPGDVVIWKSPALANTSMPAHNQPVVVSRTLDTPIIDNTLDSESTGFNQQLDLVVTIPLDDRDALVELHHDSRRFRFATPAEVEAWEQAEPKPAATAEECNCLICQATRRIAAAQPPEPGPSNSGSVH